MGLVLGICRKWSARTDNHLRYTARTRSAKAMPRNSHGDREPRPTQEDCQTLLWAVNSHRDRRRVISYPHHTGMQRTICCSAMLRRSRLVAARSQQQLRRWMKLKSLHAAAFGLPMNSRVCRPPPHSGLSSGLQPDVGDGVA